MPRAWLQGAMAKVGEKENELQLLESYVFELGVKSRLAKFRKKEWPRRSRV